MSPVFFRRILLAGIVLGYLMLGILYAVNTPAWQAPDEPAHYNYIRYFVTTGQFPVLQPGDYPHAYLEEIKRLGFPPGMSIDPIRYEFHQPPLYYILASPVYVLGEGALLPVRLFSVLLGAGIVLCTYAIALLLLPQQPEIALGATALVAFLPQHLATVSQVGNDVLAELLVALVLLLLVVWMRPAERAGRSEIRLQIGLGLLVGLVLITKTTAYIVVPVVLGVMLWRWLNSSIRRLNASNRSSARPIALDMVTVWGTAILIALPWFARNVAVYGWPDVFGLLRHDAVVVGQLRTEEFLAQNGAAEYVERLGEFTFKSFWGVFGWLGIFMDSRVYFVLTLLTLVVVAGLVFRWLVWPVLGASGSGEHNGKATAAKHAAHQPTAISSPQAAQAIAAPVLFTVLAYGWYNVQFVQHQGRYLFTALIPIAIAFALGWDEAVTPRSARLLVIGLGILGIIIAVAAMGQGLGLPRWPLALTTTGAIGLALASALPPRLRWMSFSLPFLLLPIIAFYAIWGPITP